MQILIGYLCVINVAALVMYGVDKWKAVHERWRISEAALILVAVIGGSVGALAGMYIFHHKTRKKKFAVGVPVILALQLGAAIMLAMHLAG